jgi:hypothetical protein
MDKPWTRFLTVACLAALLTVLGGGKAYAQFDHLKCYKAKDQKLFKKSRASITALQTQFGVAEDCQIKPKAKLFCVPASKIVTMIEDGMDNPFPAEELTFDRLCYKVKCPKVEIGPEEVSDQFGTRQLGKFKAAMLCTPAVKGPPPPPTTSTTTTTTTTTIPGCVEGEMQACGSNVGACQEGARTCSGGALGPCLGEIGPTAEVCDGVDNNCDGSVDEGNPGSGQACTTGLSGVCEAGTTQCVGGSLLCAQAQMPSAEVCDGLDNNCDGSVDEGNPDGGASCDGVDTDLCQEGILVCTAGALSCDDLTGDDVEICDDFDNDCDGSTDEDFDLQTDPNNCGVCNFMCGGGEICEFGSCTIP